MELGSENIGKHFATYKNRKKKIAKFPDFFRHSCDAITDVIFFMCIDAILGCDIFEIKKKRLMRFRLRLPSLGRRIMVFRLRQVNK